MTIPHVEYLKEPVPRALGSPLWLQTLLGEDALEADLVFGVLLPQPCFQAPQLLGDHRAQRGVEGQDFGEVSLCDRKSVV